MDDVDESKQNVPVSSDNSKKNKRILDILKKGGKGSTLEPKDAVKPKTTKQPKTK